MAVKPGEYRAAVDLYMDGVDGLVILSGHPYRKTGGGRWAILWDGTEFRIRRVDGGGEGDERYDTEDHPDVAAAYPAGMTDAQRAAVAASRKA